MYIYSAVTGAIAGGAIEGIRAARSGMKFFSGKPIQAQITNQPVTLTKENLLELKQRIEPNNGLVKYKPTELTKNSIEYPANNGFQGVSQEKYLLKDDLMIRYGGESGSFYAPEGTLPQSLSLPPFVKTEIMNTFQVIKPFPSAIRNCFPRF